MNRIDPLGLWYIDVNISIGWWGGITWGATIGSSGIHKYFGVGVISPPGGIAVTWSPNDPSPGVNAGFQAGYWGGGQIGYGFCENGGLLGEYGFVTPGGSLTVYYVWKTGRFSLVPWKK